MKEKILELAVKTAQAKGLTGLEHIICGIIQKESAFNPYTARYEPHYRWLYKPEKFYKTYSSSIKTEIVFQKTSWGLMQVMGALARELGYEKPLPFLFVDVEAQLGLGITYFKMLLDRYGNIEDAVSAYNAGYPAKNEAGMYINQNYVSDVLFYASFFKEGGDVA